MSDVRSNELREALAALAHIQWSEWTEYMFSKCFHVMTTDEEGALAIPSWAVERWKRQMNTLYIDLPEEEKESDRAEADRILALFAKFQVESRPEVLLQACGVALAESIVLDRNSFELSPALPDAIREWRNAEGMAHAMRMKAEEMEAKALQQVCHPEFVHPDGCKLTNEAARKAYATEQALEDALCAGVLEAHARALRFWVEALIAMKECTFEVPLHKRPEEVGVDG